MKHILIVDDHQIVLDGLRSLLEAYKDIDIIEEASSGDDALKKVYEGNIDIVLLDINLPDKNGFEVCKEIKNYNKNVKVIALTMHGDAGYLSKMLKMGVDGYLLKNAGREEIITAITTVTEGSQYFSKEVINNMLLEKAQVQKKKTPDFIQKLTRREKEVLQLIVEEFTTDEIAEKLFISSTTVISHRQSLLRKLNAKNTAGLVKAAYEFNLLSNT